MAMSDYLNAVADTFQIALGKNGSVITGVISHPLKTIVPDYTTYLRVQVADSLLYDAIGTTGVANVLMHIGSGNLYCYVLCEHKAQDILKLFFLDGSKLGLEPNDLGKVNFFPTIWSREKVFEIMVDGLVACYWKLSSDTKWTAAPDIKSRIKTYVQEIKDGKSYSEAAKATWQDGDKGPEHGEPTPEKIDTKKIVTAQQLSGMTDPEYAEYLSGDTIIDVNVINPPINNTATLDCGSDECSWVEDDDDFWCVSCGLTSGDVPALEGLSLEEVRDAVNLPG